MKKNQKTKHHYDISLQNGVGAGLITWISALMVFFVALSLGAWFILSSVSQGWVSDLSGNLTIELKPGLSSTAAKMTPDEQRQAFDEKVKKALLFVKQHTAIEEASLVDPDDVKSLIEPWLGHTLSEEIPLPALISARLKNGGDIVTLKKDLADVLPDAVLDTHTDTLKNVQSLVNTIQIFSLLMASIIVTLAIVTISGIVRAKFSIHQQEVETLHLIGASDEYIARQFRHHTLAGSLKGSLIGLCGFLVAAFFLLKSIARVDVSSSLTASPQALQGIAILLSTLIISSIIAHMTAQITVMRELAKMP